jgi:hypothetical protein
VNNRDKHDWIASTNNVDYDLSWHKNMFPMFHIEVLLKNLLIVDESTANDILAK